MTTWKIGNGQSQEIKMYYLKDIIILNYVNITVVINSKYI